MRHGIIAAVAFGVSGVTEENTWDGTWSKFVRSGGSYTGVTTTAEDAEAVIGGRRPKKEVMRSIAPSGPTRAKVNKKGGSGEHPARSEVVCGHGTGGCECNR